MQTLAESFQRVFHVRPSKFEFDFALSVGQVEGFVGVESLQTFQASTPTPDVRIAVSFVDGCRLHLG